MDMKEIVPRINQLMAVDYKGELLVQYLTIVLIMLIEILRQLRSDDFCRGFLQGALNDIEKGDTYLLEKEVKH